MSDDPKNRIRELNDAFRRSLITDAPLGKLYATAGVASLGVHFRNQVIEAVAAFNAFTEDIDPSGAHDMIRVTVDGVIVWGKIDCYCSDDPDLGSAVSKLNCNSRLFD